jgi:hypothetical protein
MSCRVVMAARGAPAVLGPTATFMFQSAAVTNCTSKLLWFKLLLVALEKSMAAAVMCACCMQRHPAPCSLGILHWRPPRGKAQAITIDVANDLHRCERSGCCANQSIIPYSMHGCVMKLKGVSCCAKKPPTASLLHGVSQLQLHVPCIACSCAGVGILLNFTE